MPTLEARVTTLEERMDEQERLRASQDHDLSDIGEKLRVQHELIQALRETQSEHNALLNRHTALHKSHQGDLARIKLDVSRLQGTAEQIVGMLDTLIERDSGR